jgi:anti-sigma factor (TIGR02949 family)
MTSELNCQSLPRWIEPFLDDQLDVQMNHAIVQHLAACPSCTEKFEVEERFRALVKRGLLASVKAPEGLWSRFLARAVQALPMISLADLAEAAAKYHRRLPAGLKVEGARTGEILAYYESAAGYLPCDHHHQAMARAGARWESASVAREAFPGRSLAWRTYRCNGDVVSHVSVPRDQVGVLNAGILKFPFYSFTGGGSTVSVTDCITHVCGFVTENEPSTMRVTAEIGADFL